MKGKDFDEVWSLEKIVVSKILLAKPNHIDSISKILQHPGAIIERGGFQFVSGLIRKYLDPRFWCATFLPRLSLKCLHTRVPFGFSWSENVGNIELRALALLGFIENKILAVQKF